MLKELVVSLLTITALVATAFAMEPDALDADPDHYTLEFENDYVRIIRIKYGPGEASIMHSHGPSVAVALSEAHFSMTLPDGTVLDEMQAVGNATWADAGDHLPANLGDQAAEVVLIELKE